MKRIILLTLIFCGVTDANRSRADISVLGYLNDASLENLAANPTCVPAATCPQGRVYWNTASGEPRIWDGVAWQQILAGASVVPDPLTLSNNSAATPTYSFSSEVGSGLFRNAAGDASIADGGVEIMSVGSANGVRIDTNNISGAIELQFMGTSSAQIYATDGVAQDLDFRANDQIVFRPGGITTADLIIQPDGQLTSEFLGGVADPTYSWSGASTSGLYYNSGASEVRIAQGGVEIASFDTDDVTFTRQFLAQTGNSTDPGIAFAASPGTGFYRGGSTQLDVVVASTRMGLFASSSYNFGLFNDAATSNVEIQFLNDNDTHIYSEGPDMTIRVDSDNDSANGTIDFQHYTTTAMRLFGTLVQIYIPNFSVGSDTLCRGGINGLFSIGPCTSSIRYKDNPTDLTDAEIDKVDLLRPVSFHWKESGKRDYGMIAEEVDLLFPEVVEKSPNENGDIETVGLNYRHMVAMVIAHSQRLAKDVEAQQIIIEDLTERLEALEATQ